MNRVRFRRRAVLLALLGVHGLGSLAAVADARLERPRSDLVHLEASGSDCTEPVHVHDQCALCQHLGTRIDVRAPAPWTPHARYRHEADLRTESSPPATILPRPRGRSPPKA